MRKEGDTVAGLIKSAVDAAGQVLGIFQNNVPKPEVADEEINTPDEQQLVLMVDGDYQIFKKKRQPLEDVWRKEERMDKGNQWEGLRPPDKGVYPERMEYVGNYAWSQCQSILARLTGWVPMPEFEATESGDENKANMLNQFIPYELNQIKFKPKHLRAVGRMVVHGVLLYKIIYNPDVQGGRGMNRWNGQNDIIPLNYGSFFPDPAIKDFIYLQDGRAHIVNNLLTLQFIRERWPVQGAKVTSDNTSSDSEIYDVDSVTSVGTSYNTEDNTTTANVIEYWYKGIPKYMSDDDKKLFQDMADENLSEGLDPSVNLAKAKGTYKGVHCLYVTTNRVFLEHKSYIFDHGQYPFVARCLFPEENNPWGKGYMRDLISPQTFYNRFVELAIEITSKIGNGVIVYGTTAGLTEAFKQIWKRFRSVAGAMLPVQGDVNQVKELQGVPPNQGIYQYIQHFLEMMQKIPGMFDSANGAANADVNSGKQSEALINAAQGRLSKAAEIIEDGLQEAIEQFVELCAQFYTSERVTRITGKDVSFSRDKMLSQAPAQIDHPETGQPMQVQEQYVPKFDTKVHIGIEKPKDREYWMQTALTLFQTIDPMTQMPVIDAQAVKYVVENGRMEPMSTIEERMNTEQQIQQQMIQMQQKIQEDDQEIQTLNAQIEQMHEMITEGEQHNMQGHTEALQAMDASHAAEQEQALKFQQHQQGLDQQAHQQKIDIANTLIKAKQVQQAGEKVTSGANNKGKT